MTTSEWSVTEERHGVLVEVIAVVAALAALSGLLLDGVYGTDEATTQMLRGFDAVTLLVAAPALLLVVRSERIVAARRHLLVASLLAYLGYTYAFDLLGAGFTDLLLLHAALVSATLVALVLTMRAVSRELVTHAVPHRVHVPAAVLALLAVSLGTMWASACIAYVVDGTVPAGSSLVESDTVVHLGIVLDLTLLVPLYATAAVLLWLRRPWGFVLAAVALVSGTLHQVSYVVALLFQHAAGVPGAVAADPFEPVIIAAYVVATVLLLRRRASSSAGWLTPQDYSADRRYRRPSSRYARISRIVGVPLTSLGLAPRHAVTLEVRGRRSGRPRKVPVLVTSWHGEDYLVSLAGESQWVRNVRAAEGRAVLHRRGVRPVSLVELPVPARPEVLAAYQAAGAERSGAAAGRLQARYNFGLGPEPTAADFAALAPRYPVFRVVDRAVVPHPTMARDPGAATVTAALAATVVVLLAAALWSVATGDGERGFDLAAGGVAVAALAVLVGAALRPPEIEARVDASTLVVAFRGWDVVWTLRRELRVPLVQVRAVDVHCPTSLWSGWWHRRLGIVVPGTIKAGWFGGAQGRELWDVRAAADVIDVRLADPSPVRRLVLQVPDPAGLAAALATASGRSPDL